MTATTAECKQLIGRYLQALSGQAKTPDLVARWVSDPHLMEHIEQAEAAFPCYELIADELIAERDLVMMRGTFRGVHQGSFAGIPATGRSVSAPLMIVYRLANNHIVEHWMQFDAGAVIAQLQQASVAHA
jgi:predicted ester cyclase